MPRLATREDADYIKDTLLSRRQKWSERAISHAIEGHDFIVVVDPPTGLFWARLDPEDETVVHAGITFATDDAQTIALYKAALAEQAIRWPKATTLKVRMNPTLCEAQAFRGATRIARMKEKAASDTWREYEVDWATLTRAVR